MPDYRVFGGVLRSELPFPELAAMPPSPRRAAWTFVRGAPRALDDARRVGQHRYPGDVDVSLLRAGDVWRVRVGDLGDFDVEPADDGGDLVTWRACAEAREPYARFDLLGRVLPIALHRRGALVLHGSAVALGADAAIAFVAPKGHGKSTLALALAQSGARLLADDATALVPHRDGTLALPGVHAVRLWPDSAAALDAHAYGTPGALGRKLVVQAVPEALRAERATPLRAIYMLEAAEEHGDDAARRTAMSAVPAAVALVRHTTAGGLLGGEEARRVLARAADVVRCVPVYALRVARDFARLDAVVSAIRRWHPSHDATVGAAARHA